MGSMCVQSEHKTFDLTFPPLQVTLPLEVVMSTSIVEKFTAGIACDLSWADKSDTKNCITNPAIMGDIIMHLLSLACDKANRLFYYYKGVYVENGELAVQEMYTRVLHHFDKKDEFNATLVDRMQRYIFTHVPFVLDRPDLYRICMLNGVYDWRDEGSFIESDPTYLTTTQIPIKYNPDATCPRWDEFLSEVCPEGAGLLREIVALCLVPFTGLQKCVVLLGKGSNGKGKFIDGLSAAIGVKNICNVPLQKLSGPQERFNTAMLVGKLTNIFGDMSVKTIEDTASFKALTGEDTITVEYKNKNPFSYLPFTRLIFSCNEVVKSQNDESDGYKRRFIHIPFLRTFKVDPKLGQDIKAELSSPSELSGLFNQLRQLLPNLIENGFTITDEIAALVDNYTPMPYETRQWLISNIVEDPQGAIPARALYIHYVHNCPCTEPFDRTRLVSYMKTVFPSCKANHSTRIWKTHDPIKCYKGVKMIDSSIDIGLKHDAVKLHNVVDLEDSIVQ
jgi:P4 family phage/plasmid primase-like protien